MLMKLKIGPRLLGGFFTVAVIVGINGVVGMYNVNRAGQSALAVLENENLTLQASIKLRSALEAQIAALHEDQMRNAETNQAFDQAASEFDHWREELETGNLTEAEQASIAIIGQKHAELMEESRNAMAAKLAADQGLEVLADDLEAMDRSLNMFQNRIIASGMPGERLNTAWREVMPAYQYILNHGEEQEKARYRAVNAEINAWPDYESVRAEHDSLVSSVDQVFQSYDLYLRTTNEVSASFEEIDLIAADLRSALDSLETQASAQMAGARVSVESAQRRSLITLSGLTVLAFLIALLGGLYVSRGITTPLKETVDVAERIAMGDLSARITVDGRQDEMGSMLNSFSHMLASLQQMADLAERIADGDLTVGVEPQSENDVLGKSFSTMVTSLQEMTGAVARIAAGDLTVEIQPQSERDVLGNALAEMVASLRTQINEIAAGVSVLVSSSNEISASVAQLLSGATETATSVNETTTTMEEVRQTAQVSSRKAEQVSENALEATQISVNGQRFTDDTIAGMNHIRDQMEAIAESIVQLSDQGQSIGEIIASVNDLADQSNLLAVNASIEAAKAGEQGKGFAVVAQEVRSLAEQSKQATDQVQGILNDIQRATGTAVMATEQGAKAVEAGVEKSGQAGESIRELANRIALAAQAATQIAASTRQQFAGIDQVATAMESINQATEQNVKSIKQVELAARNIQDLGRKLLQFVEKYQV